MVDVALYLRFAKVAQVKDFVKNQKNLFLKGGITVLKYTRLLEIVRKSVEFMYNNNPSETTLDQVANFMLNLSRRRTLTPAAIVAPFEIIVQPQSQAVDEGDNVVFTVQAAGGTIPYVYQWYFNLIPLVGEEADTLSLTNVDGSESGDYYCVVTDDNGAGTILQSDNAMLAINVGAITGYLHYGDIDPATDLQGGIDNFTYQSNYSITHNAPISVPLSATAANNKYLIVKVPSTESNKTTWFSTGFASGVIPDFVWQSMVTFGGFDYYFTRNASSFDFTVPLIFS